MSACILKIDTIYGLSVIFTIGFFFHKENRKFERAILLLFTVMVLNTFLKWIFKVPLKPHLGVGYAFPSGHLHASVIFCFYLYTQLKENYLKAIFAILPILHGASLIYCNFHDFSELVGAIAFVLAEIWIIIQLEKKYSKNTIDKMLLCFSFVVIILLSVAYKKLPEWHVFLGFYLTCGLIYSAYLIEKDFIGYNFGLKTVWQKMCMILISFTYMFISCQLFSFLLRCDKKYYFIHESRWFFVGFCTYVPLYLFKRYKNGFFGWNTKKNEESKHLEKLEK